MKYVNAVALAGAMVWLVGCASVSRVVVVEPIGPAPTEVAQGVGDGSLVIFSAHSPADVDINTQEWRWNNDFGRNAFLSEAAHSDYTIYGPNGDVVRHVRNARGANDDAPTVVALPAGTYKVEAEGINCNGGRVKVLMTVAIKSAQTTMAYLGGDASPLGQPREGEVAKLPCGKVVGWRAPEGGLASIPPTAQAN